MATVPIELHPEEAQYLAANFPQYLSTKGTNFPVSGLAFAPNSANPDEAAFWKFKALNYGTGNLTLDLDWYAATATTGTLVWEAQLACVTPDTDNINVETKAFATLNFVQDTHLGTTGKRPHRCTITLTNLDSLAVNDEVWIRIARDANSTNATDNMAGDAILTLAVLSYSDT